MPDSFDTRAFQTRLQRLDDLLREVEHSADPASRARIREIVQAILELHGNGLERLLSLLESAGETIASVRDAIARDEIVGGLLLLHDLHPLDLETRVLQALDQVRPALRSHGGSVTLLGICEGVVRLRLEGHCHGCPSSAVTMRQTIEAAILARAPDAIALEVEGLAEDPPTAPDGRALVAIAMP